MEKNDTIVIFGWPNCHFAKQAIQKAKDNGVKFIFVDTTKNNNYDFINKLGNSWKSPHIFKYIGGSEDFENMINSEKVENKNYDDINSEIRDYISKIFG